VVVWKLTICPFFKRCATFTIIIHVVSSPVPEDDGHIPSSHSNSSSRVHGGCMMDTFPAPDLFHLHTEKREFSATKFEIGKPCRRFNRMLQSSPRQKLVQSQGGRSLTPSHPKIYLFQSSSRMWNNGYTSQLLLDSSSLPVLWWTHVQLSI